LRYPGPKVFQLVGSIDCAPDQMFVIGKQLSQYTAPKSGTLTCFANDFDFMYWNNWGWIQLEVTRLD
jgi:hypothetical protein